MRVLRVLAVVLLFNLASCSEQNPREITFAQLTDAHIFDEKSTKDVAELLRYSADDRDALRWAIDTINRRARSLTIDFVVYAGDWGLENVDFAGSDCTTLPVRIVQNRLHPFPWQSAVKEVANEFSRLKITQVFMVPGNNDLVMEKATDLSRYNCFMDKLRVELKTMNPALRVTNLDATTSIEIKGVHFAGLNSASFKDQSNYKDDRTRADICTQHPPHEACASVQIDALSRLPRPLVLFTHVPDLVDPEGKRRNPALEESAWLAIEGDRRREWLKVACPVGLLAIMAGHFHAPDRGLYGNTTGTKQLAMPGSECVQAKTVVAPPLAIKYQDAKLQQARGFLLVTVTSKGVRSHTPDWLPTKP